MAGMVPQPADPTAADPILARPAFQSPSEAEAYVLAHLASYEGGGVIALSGGADSALLLDLAAEAWGPGRCLAVTSRSASLPAEELRAARAQAAAVGVEHMCLRGSELDIEAFRRNAPDRCFHCKDHLYGEMRKVARARGLAYVVDGTNADDAGEHRPGLGAARRHAVRSPLLACGVGKPTVRAISRHRGLATWDKPAEACLSSRFPYGTEVTREGLRRVEEAERALKALGFLRVRVRDHDPVARVEIPVAELRVGLAPGMRERLVEAVKAAGFTYVALDLEGLRSGSLNEVLGRGSTGPAPSREA